MCCCLSYKDTILKANHSDHCFRQYPRRLLLILQRYYFESESQQILKSNSTPWSCCLSYKDTILKANHSNGQLYLAIKLLLLILQRYYFESESQLTPYDFPLNKSCCLSYKDTILKANHSVIVTLPVQFFAVAYPTKILF